MKLFLWESYIMSCCIIGGPQLYDSFSLARKMGTKTMPAVKHSRRTFEKLLPLCIPFHLNLICSRLYYVHAQVPLVLLRSCDALNKICTLQLNLNICPVQHVQGLQRLA